MHAHETILWARKDKNASHYFNKFAMDGMYFPSDILKKKDERMHTVWSIMPRMESEKEQGCHPTQKPIALLRRIVLASTRPGDVIFDPFNGGGTTGIAVASIGKRKYIGCDLSKEYIDLTIRRYEALERNVPIKTTKTLALSIGVDKNTERVQELIKVKGGFKEKNISRLFI